VKFRGKLDLVVKDKKDELWDLLNTSFSSSLVRIIGPICPLNLQQLLYSLGVEEAIKQKPVWYQWNIVQKSMLRRRT